MRTAATHTRPATASRKSTAARSIVSTASAASRNDAAEAASPLNPHTSSTGAIRPPAAMAPESAGRSLRLKPRLLFLRRIEPHGEQPDEGAKIQQTREQHRIHGRRDGLHRRRGAPKSSAETSARTA